MELAYSSTSSSDSGSDSSSSTDESDFQISSWTYICRSFSDLLNSGDHIDVETIYKSAEQAFLNEEPVNSIKLFSLGLKQHAAEIWSQHLGPETRKILPSNIVDHICLAINQCAIYVANEFRNSRQISIMKQSVIQALENILDLCNKLLIENTSLLCSAASLYFSLKEHKKGFKMATKAVLREPSSILAQETYENICCHLVERWHFAMLNDKSRNQAYQYALCDTIKRMVPSPNICDVGCGTGLLSLIAGEHFNCGKVFAIEKSSVMCSVANEVFDANLNKEHAKRVKVINKMSTQMSVPADMSQRADILVTETFDAGLFGEGILPTLCHAWTKLLKNESTLHRGVVIPWRAELFLQIVESEFISNENRVKGEFCDLDLKNICICSTVGICDSDPYTTHDLKILPGGYTNLSDPLRFMEVNFNDPNELHQMNQGITQELSVTITKAGRLDALVMWFSLHLSETAHISTHTSSNSCWEQAVFPAHAVKIAQSTGSKVNLILKPGDKLNLIQCVKGAKLCIDVNRISTVDENGSDYCQTTSHNIPRFLSTIEDLCKQKVYCLSNSDVVNLNNSGIQQILNHHLREIITQTKGGNLNFVHLNHGFSPMCIQALKLGYQRGVAIACHPVHSDLLQEMATRHHVDFGRLKLVSDVDEFIELMEGDNTPQTGTTNNSPNCLAKRMTEDTSQTTPAGLSAVELRLRDNDRGVVVLCDVVDYQGRIVENLSDQLNVLKFCLSDYTSKFVLPESVEVYGVLIESQDLLCLSRIQSDDNTLGYKIGQFFNKFSTRNYQGIMLSTLSHTKLSEPFKMFTFSLKKIFDAPWSEPVSEQEKGAQTTAHGPSSKTTHNDGSDHSECVEFDTDGSSHSECDKFEIKSSFSKTLHVIGSNDITTSDSGQPASACEQTNTASMSITEKLSPSSCHECPTTAHPTDVVHKITQVYKKSDCSIKCQHEPNMTESTALSKTVDTKDCEHLENTITDLNVENNNVSLDSSSICFSPTQSITSKFDLNESVSLSKQGFEDQAKRRKINSQSKEETFEHPQSENENIDSKNMDQTQNLKIPIIQTGRVTALVYWFVQHISPTASINTLDQPLYWQQAAVMAQQSPSVLQGEVLGLECRLGNSAISFNIIHE